jgi:hypothetical protein
VYRAAFTTLSVLLLSNIVSAQYYDTLPKGVRLVMGKYVQSSINSSYNNTQSETPFTAEIKADIIALEKIDDPIVKEALAVLKPYGDAYDKINLGTHKVDAKADVSVNAYAFGYGISNKITAYIGVPIYKANVSVNYTKTKSSSNKEVSEELQKEYGDDFAQGLGSLVENFYEIDGSTIQSALVNALGYEEIGDWNGTGLGDVELGVMYNFLRTESYGLMLTLGAIAPTGYVDDPDIIQDIGFGDGQWDGFLEFGGGKRLSRNVILNAYSRYTYQFSSEKNLRIPYSEDVSISDKKDKFKEKLGNKILAVAELEIIVNDWFKLKPSYIYTDTEKAKYTSTNGQANKLLALNSQSSSTSVKMLGQLTSVKLFNQKKFLLPGQINISYQSMLYGKNTPKVDIFEMEFRMFF